MDLAEFHHRHIMGRDHSDRIHEEVMFPLQKTKEDPGLLLNVLMKEMKRDITRKHTYTIALNPGPCTTGLGGARWDLSKF